MLQINPGLVGRMLVGQALIGDLDGTNTVFSTPRLFLHTANYRESVYLRGLRRLDGGNDYVATESGGPGTGYDTIVFLKAPRPGDNLLIDYFPASI